VASQVHGDFQIEVAPASSPDAVQAVRWLRIGCLEMDWAADGGDRAQTPDIRLVNPGGGETVLLSDAQHISDQVTTCGAKYYVFRSAGGRQSFDESLAYGQRRNQFEAAYVWPNESEPECAREGNGLLRGPRR